MTDESWDSMLRAAIDNDTRSIYEIAQDCGLQRIKIAAFRRGEKTLNITSAEKLGRALGLELREVERGEIDE